jgi:hypothetical protein
MYIQILCNPNFKILSEIVDLASRVFSDSITPYTHTELQKPDPDPATTYQQEVPYFSYLSRYTVSLVSSVSNFS